MSMENMFAPKAPSQNNENIPSPELVNQSENIVAQATDIENSLNETPEGEVKNNKGAKISTFVTALTAGGLLGAYNLSESFQATLNNKIQALQNIDWESSEVIKNASLTAGALAVTGLAVMIMKMKRAYEKQQNGLVS